MRIYFTRTRAKGNGCAQSILIGYDRSGMTTKTGIVRQVSQMIGGKVVSSHRTPAMRDRVFRKMRALMEKDRKSKNPKGYIVVAIGALDMASLPGNPSSIFTDYVGVPQRGAGAGPHRQS